MATTRHVSTIADKGPLTCVNGANGSINPQKLGLAARQLVAESQRTNSDPASITCLQQCFELSYAQLASLERFHAENPAGFVSVSARGILPVHCPCLHPSTTFDPIFQSILPTLPVPPGSTLTPTQVMQMCFGGYRSVSAYELYGFAEPVMPPVNLGNLTWMETTTAGTHGFPHTDSPSSVFSNSPYSTAGSPTISFSPHPAVKALLQRPDFQFSQSFLYAMAGELQNPASALSPSTMAAFAQFQEGRCLTRARSAITYALWGGSQAPPRSVTPSPQLRDQYLDTYMREVGAYVNQEPVMNLQDMARRIFCSHTAGGSPSILPRTVNDPDYQSQYSAIFQTSDHTSANSIAAHVMIQLAATWQ